MSQNKVTENSIENNKDYIIQVISSSILFLIAVVVDYYFLISSDYYFPEFIFSLFILGLSLFLFLASFFNKKAPIMLGFVSLLITGIFFAINQKGFGTDEMVLDYIAAKMFLQGKNPYTVSSYLYYEYVIKYIPSFYVTPTLTQSIISRYTYTPLEFFLLIPTAMFNIKPAYVDLAGAFSDLIIIYFVYKKYNYESLIPFIFASFTLYNTFIGYAIGGTYDYMWLAFLLLSIYFYDNDLLSGALFGLSLAFKETPIFFLPFLLVIEFTQKGGKKTLKFLMSLIAVFVAISIRFLSYGYISSVFTNIKAIALGLSSSAIYSMYFGVSTNLLYTIFFVVFAVLSLFSFVFIKYIGNMIMLIPILLFIVFPRNLSNYTVYSVAALMDMIPFLFSNKRKIKGINKKEAKAYILALFIVLLVMFTPAFSLTMHQNNTLSVKVLSVSDPLQYNNSITGITLEINSTYPEQIPFNFVRVYQNANGEAANGFLWKPNTTKLNPGINIVEITPYSPYYALKTQPFYVNIYYNSSSATAFFKPNISFVYPANPLIPFVVQSGIYIDGYDIYYYKNYSAVVYVANSTQILCVNPFGNAYAVFGSINLGLLDKMFINFSASNLSYIYYLSKLNVYAFQGTTLAIAYSGYYVYFVPSLGNATEFLKITNNSAYITIPSWGVIDIKNILLVLNKYYNFPVPSGIGEIYTIYAGNSTYCASYYFLK